MPKIDNKKFYTSAIEMYGTTAKGVNWHSASSQKLRFKILLEFLPKDMQQFTLLDAGCGFGDLYPYLQKKNKEPKNYIGVDALQDMVAIASNNTGCEIILADLTKESIPQVDYVVCSGAMNTLEREETLEFIYHCYSAANKGFIFNILHGDEQSQTYNYLTTQDIKLIAKELEVEHLHLKDDYLESDITVGFFK